MAVLSGDMRRLADASGRYDLIETQGHLLELAEMVNEHFATMRAPDPRQVKRMFALLSAVIGSVAFRDEPPPRSVPEETAPENDPQPGADASNADATLALVHEEIAPWPVSVEAVETAEVEQPVEYVEALSLPCSSSLSKS